MRRPRRPAQLRRHRANLFHPEWRIQGLAVEQVDRFGNERNVTLRANRFGDG